jgi:hypothetical protein
MAFPSVSVLVGVASEKNQPFVFQSDSIHNPYNCGEEKSSGPLVPDERFSINVARKLNNAYHNAPPAKVNVEPTYMGSLK